MATAGADVDRLLRTLAEAPNPPWSVDEDAALVSSLSTLQDVLGSVEKQSFEGTETQDWMRKIKKMAHQIEDILDESEDRAIIPPSPRSGWSRGTIFLCTSSLFLLHSNMAHRMKKIRRKLDRAAKDLLIFSLPQHNRSYVQQFDEQEVFDGTAIVGRDNDKQHIEDLLLQNDSETLTIIPIVGLEGLGKTTLARLIFDDNSEGCSFDLHIWVHLNKNLDLNNIASEIISQANKTEEKISEVNTNSQIQGSLQLMKNHLQEVLHDNSCLIVLDDLWSTDKSQLAELKDMLKGKCTKVIITTCSAITAELMHTNGSYKLSSLSEDDCWTIFSQRAFRHGDEGSKSCFKEIGREIVKRCEGIPAVAHSLGSIVHNKGMNMLSAVRDEEIWKLEKKFPQKLEVFLPFKKIYYNMPFALRSCFVYLSTFPKGSSIGKEKLIREWIELGILGSKRDALPAYVQGKIFIQELLSVSFLQAPQTSSVTTTNQFGDPLTLNIHNLVHDFAIYVACDDLIILDNGKVQSDIVGKPAFRYALLTNYSGESTLHKGFLTGTRALSLRNFEPIKLLEEIFSVVKYLRVLDLSGCCIEELPDSISQLKHLRYLDGSDLKIQALPISFCRLHELCFLDLSSCTQLKELPESFGELTNLEDLNLSSCSKLKLLPKSFGNLCFLRILRLASHAEYQRFKESLKDLVNLNVVAPPEIGNITPSIPSQNIGTGMQPYAAHDETEISNLEIGDNSLHAVESYSKLQQHQESLANLDNLEVLEPLDPGIALPSPKRSIGTDEQPCVTGNKPKVSNLAGDSSLHTAKLQQPTWNCEISPFIPVSPQSSPQSTEHKQNLITCKYDENLSYSFLPTHCILNGPYNLYFSIF